MYVCAGYSRTYPSLRMHVCIDVCVRVCVVIGSLCCIDDIMQQQRQRRAKHLPELPSVLFICVVSVCVCGLGLHSNWPRYKMRLTNA